MMLEISDQKAKVSALVTFNVRDFTSFALNDVEIRLPDETDKSREPTR